MIQCIYKLSYSDYQGRFSYEYKIDGSKGTESISRYRHNCVRNSFYGIILSQGGVYVVIEDKALESYEEIVPDAWHNSYLYDAKYMATFSLSKTNLESCHYNPGGTVIRRRVLITVQIKDQDTEQVLTRKTFSGGDPEVCPSSETFSQSVPVEYIDGSFPDKNPIQGWFITFMNDIPDSGLKKYP